MRLSRLDAQAATDLARELMTIRLDDTSSIDRIVAQTRDHLELELLLIYGVRGRGPELERFHASGAVGVRSQLAAAIAANITEPILFYDLIRPQPDQQNHLVEATAWIDRDVPGTWHASRMCREVMSPLGLGDHQQVRALLCEGGALLGWFGAVHPVPLTDRQRQFLSALLVPTRKRLSAERRLLDAPRTQAALSAALEQIGAPTFIVTARGLVFDANAAGHDWLQDGLPHKRRALVDAIAGRPSLAKLELLELRDHGTPCCYLAILQLDSLEDRLDACAAACRVRWGLTPRQTQVLELLVRGQTNASMAAALGCGERAIEFHITGLFDRAGVDSRAALVARALMISPVL